MIQIWLTVLSNIKALPFFFCHQFVNIRHSSLWFRWIVGCRSLPLQARPSCSTSKPSAQKQNVTFLILTQPYWHNNSWHFGWSSGRQSKKPMEIYPFVVYRWLTLLWKWQWQVLCHVNTSLMSLGFRLEVSKLKWHFLSYCQQKGKRCERFETPERGHRNPF